MKIGHTSDLHLGRQMHHYSLEKDQEHILGEIINVIKDQNLDVLIIAGDVYDSRNPPKYAVKMLNRFLASVPDTCRVIMTPGNHDLQELVGYGDGWAKNIHPVGRYDGSIEPVTLSDTHGKVHFYPVPFVRPHDVKQYIGDRDIETPDQAFSAILGSMDYDVSERNVLILHQTVLNGDHGVECSGSELSIIGGEEAVSSSLFNDFDYVALGHIHKPQNISSDNIRYCGTPMIYNIDEEGQDKGMTVVELGPKGDRAVTHVSLKPLRQVRSIKGTMDELITKADEIGFGPLVYATLTEYASEAAERLKKHCDLVHVSHEYSVGEDRGMECRTPEQISKMDPTDLFCEYYKALLGKDISEEERQIFIEAVRITEGGSE